MAGRKTSGKDAKNAKDGAPVNPEKLSAAMMTLMKAVVEKSSPRRADEFFVKLAPPEALVEASPSFAAAGGVAGGDGVGGAGRPSLCVVRD